MNNPTDENGKKYPKGHLVGMWMGIGIAIFAGLGITFSLITENFGLIGIGPAIGTGFGLSIGQSIENKYNKEGRIRPLTETEKKTENCTNIWYRFTLIGSYSFFVNVSWKIKAHNKTYTAWTEGPSGQPQRSIA